MQRLYNDNLKRSSEVISDMSLKANVLNFAKTLKENNSTVVYTTLTKTNYKNKTFEHK